MNEQRPFGRSIRQRVAAFDESEREALENIQSHVDTFYTEINNTIHRQDDAHNQTLSSLSTQLIVLITATLVFLTGCVEMIYQDDKTQALGLFVSVAFIELVAVFAVMCDYILNSRFYRNNAKIYSNSQKIITEKIMNGEIQTLEEMYAMHRKQTSDKPQETSNSPIYVACFMAMLGMVILLGWILVSIKVL